MMSGHGANPIFFDEKIKIGRPVHSVPPQLPTSDKISFLPYPPNPPNVYHHLYSGGLYTEPFLC